MVLSCQGLCKNIGDVLMSTNIMNLKLIMGNALAHGIVGSVDMFDLSVIATQVPHSHSIPPTPSR